jgi:hypothetical protein
MGKKVKVTDGTLETPEVLSVEEVEVPEVVDEETLSDKKRSFAEKILECNKSIDVVYVVDGLFYQSKKAAEGRAFSTGGKIFEVCRNVKE